MIYAGVRGLGDVVGGALGAEDPQLKKMSQRNQLLQQLDVNNPESFVAVAKQAASIGDGEFAVGLIEKAKSLAESQSKIALNQAQTLKALQPAKLTGDERYIEALRIVETKLQKGEKPTLTELANANISGQMLSKPRSYLDQASGQMITQAATDPSKAFPLAYKEMGATTEGGATTVPKPTVQQATSGNLPAGSQKEIGEIAASLTKLENSAPELDSFLKSLINKEVVYDATSNTLDILGTEIDTEFNNISTAIATKTDNSAAAITGGSITGITDLAIADGGTGASTATAAINNLLPAQTSAANKYLQSDGTNVSWDAVTLSTSDITGTLAVANGGTGVTTSTGTTNVVLSNSPTSKNFGCLRNVHEA